MIYFLIGHRGVGKTFLLKRIEQYYKKEKLRINVFDLDKEIEHFTGKNIPSIFAQEGESFFRNLEINVLKKIILNLKNVEINQKNKNLGDTYISLGAGFQNDILHRYPAIWVIRNSDIKGRIFLNRPRLNKSLNPLDDFFSRFKLRQNYYQNHSWEELTLIEGQSYLSLEEKKFFLNKIKNLKGSLTVLSHNIENNKTWNYFYKKRKEWDVNFWEIRNDLLSEEQIDLSLKSLKDQNIIFSFRKFSKKEKKYFFENVKKTINKRTKNLTILDWPLELGKCPSSIFPKIISVHEREKGEKLFQVFNRLINFQIIIKKRSKYNNDHYDYNDHIFKAAPLIKNFKELEAGHNWMLKDPKRRCFLPRSKEGRWHWYRLCLKGKMKINFFREGTGSSQDQPLLLDWMNVEKTINNFAAIVGDPVMHSYTPAEQKNFFNKYKMPVLRIKISKEEWKNGAIDFLFKLGLRAIAVTSPLKGLAFETCQIKDKVANDFQSVNTMIFNEIENIWQGTNTDIDGLKELFTIIKKHKINSKDVAIWGGGGTLRAIKKVLPKAMCFSARTGKIKEEFSDLSSINLDDFNPKVVIWAIGRSAKTKNLFPSKKWQPQFVIDLNYSEDSPGIEYALNINAFYVSGLIMFKKQAKKQQEFWKKFL